MYLHGYGTPVNKFVARNLVNLFYEENEKRFLDGDFECNFADLALRKANLCRDDIESGDPLYYYLIADFAIKKRLEFNYFGDTSVAMKIHDEIAKYEKDRPISHKKTHTSCYPYALNIAMQGSICKITFKELKSGIKITAKRMPPSGKDKARSFFIVEPYARYCILTDNVSETAKDVSNIWTENNSNTFYADSMEDTDGKLIFKFYGKEVAYIVAKKYSYTLKSQNEKSTEKHRFAKVLFKTKGRGYDYIADGIELSVGDKVIVPTYSGEVSATVIKVFELPFKDMPLEAKRYKKIVKKV
jgi:hypothetical protein